MITDFFFAALIVAVLLAIGYALWVIESELMIIKSQTVPPQPFTGNLHYTNAPVCASHGGAIEESDLPYAMEIHTSVDLLNGVTIPATLKICPACAYSGASRG